MRRSDAACLLCESRSCVCGWATGVIAAWDAEFQQYRYTCYGRDAAAMSAAFEAGPDAWRRWLTRTPSPY